MEINNRTVYQIIWLRGISIALQLLTLVATKFILEIELAYDLMLSMILVYLIFHLFTWYQYKTNTATSALGFFHDQGIDILVLCTLLYFSGGAANPFISLLLFPLTITATVLNSKYTWIMAGITILAYSILMKFNVPLPQNHAAGHEFSLHIFGMWFGFVISAALVSFFIVEMRKTVQLKEQQLHDAHEQALKDKQLISLATLSASTAHELGTPLGSISLMCDELSEEINDDLIKEELLVPLKTQVVRCKEILSILATNTGSLHLDGGYKVAIHQFIKDLVKDWQQSNPNHQISLKIEEKQNPPNIIAERILVQAIINILDNSHRVSKQGITCFLTWDLEHIFFIINDTGPGISGELLKQIGKQPQLNSSNGMGLGLFLSHTIIERMGGEISLSNNKPCGLSTKITLASINEF